MKVVAGVPLRRPAWFFDVNEYGEGLADVGTHVVDIVQWIAFPDQILNYKTDVHILGGKRWPTVISQSDFQRVTGEAEFPKALAGHIADGKLNYYCNNSVNYTLRGVHVKPDILWNWEALARIRRCLRGCVPRFESVCVESPANGESWSCMLCPIPSVA